MPNLLPTSSLSTWEYPHLELALPSSIEEGTYLDEKLGNCKGRPIWLASPRYHGAHIGPIIFCPSHRYCNKSITRTSEIIHFQKKKPLYQFHEIASALRQLLLFWPSTLATLGLLASRKDSIWSAPDEAYQGCSRKAAEDLTEKGCQLPNQGCWLAGNILSWQRPTSRLQLN